MGWWLKGIPGALVVRNGVGRLRVSFQDYLYRNEKFVPSCASLWRRPFVRRNAEDPLWFAYGRKALAEGFRAMGLQPGDRILVPETICDVTMSALHELGLKPDFYPVKDDFSVAWEMLDPGGMPRAKALMLVHFFGFARELVAARAFCEREGLWYFEDNAHGYGATMGGHMAGRFGQFGIACPHKSVGSMLNGAVLWLDGSLVNPKAVKPASGLEPIGLGSVCKGLLRILFGWVIRPVLVVGPEPDWAAMGAPSEIECPSFGVDQAIHVRDQEAIIKAWLPDRFLPVIPVFPPGSAIHSGSFGRSAQPAGSVQERFARESTDISD